MKHKESVAFNLELYPLEYIKYAAREYSGFCSVHLEQKENKMLCMFCSDTIPAEVIGLEFGNYLIELMQQRAKA